MAGFGPMGDAGNEQFGDADDELGEWRKFVL